MSWQDEYIDHMQTLAAEDSFQREEYLEHQRDVGDAILDEEDFMRRRYGYDGWDVRLGPNETVWIRMVPRGDWFRFARLDEARGIANAILSEIEIVERERRDDWD